MNITTINKTLSMIGQILDPRNNTKPMIEIPSDKPSFQRRPIEQPLQRTTPEAAGVPSAHIEAFVRELMEDKTLRMHNLMILRGGKVIFETSFGGQDISIWKYTFSACKSITSLAIGMLIDEGRLRLDDKLIDLFPEQVNTVNRLLLKDIRVRHLLSMSSTVLFNEAESITEVDWVRGFFSSAIAGEPGKTFNYNSLNTYMLSAIVCRVSGESMSSYLERKLFAPLGITEYYWETCPSGIEKGGWGLYIRPEDIAKIAQLVMQKGKWKKRRIISEEWITMATTAHITAPEELGEFNYGYQIWVGRELKTFLFNGMLGQNVLGFWDNGIIVVTNAGNTDMFQQSSYFKIVQKYFSLPFERGLPEDQGALDALNRLKYAGGETRALPIECDWLCGFRMYPSSDLALSASVVPLIWQVAQNRYTEGLEGIEFSKEKGKLVMSYAEHGITYRIPIGFGKGEVSEVLLGGVPFLVSAVGRFSTDEDDHPVFQTTIDFLETPCSRKIKLYFMDKDTVLLKQEEMPGGGFLHNLIGEMLESFEKRPVIGAAVNKLDHDLIDYKIDKIFVPMMELNIQEKTAQVNGVQEKNIQENVVQEKIVQTER
ncbi:MAG: serine hydrolase [Lachnospiraceae bacterium]|nr:serine hydrolase [Lachnospiraceae bacterium]